MATNADQSPPFWRWYCAWPLARASRCLTGPSVRNVSVRLRLLLPCGTRESFSNGHES